MVTAYTKEEDKIRITPELNRCFVFTQPKLPSAIEEVLPFCCNVDVCEKFAGGFYGYMLRLLRIVIVISRCRTYFV